MGIRIVLKQYLSKTFSEITRELKVLTELEVNRQGTKNK